MMLKTITSFILITCLFVACQDKQVIYSDNFDKDISIQNSNYWTEGTSKVEIKNERLFIDANPDGNGEDFKASTVWLNKVFSDDIQIDYDVHIISSKGNKNNLNFFLMYSHPVNFELKSTQHERTNGAYSKYHKLNGYIITNVADGNGDTARFRMRDNPGFHLLSENNAYNNMQGITYHITIKKEGAKITYLVDGQIMAKTIDNKNNNEHQTGYIGFRTWQTELWVDNIKVISLCSQL